MAKDLTVDTFSEAILDLVRRVERLLSRQAADPRQRILVALAGVPGSGKSTVSHALLAELASRGVQDVAVVPMDGFHYTKEMLSSFKDPEQAFRRRGAPFTFDAEGFVQLVQTLQTTPVTASQETELLVLAPGFDHALKDPVRDEISISSRARIVIIEGNYTLLKQSPWNKVAEMCAEKWRSPPHGCLTLTYLFRWFVDAPLNLIRERLAQRHLAAGIETSMVAATKRAEENDIPNGEMIRLMLVSPDVIIEN